ncbi:putative bifunctional diguanylate cyclase/phosphodiesterase [Trinickia acidisoli]|uniref:putative bifunctional diguanylate cyclase/phosphodiesterase n=1 Tax=Trinickia acidisoli TaxID=2767482 RepID=UPI001A8CA6E2|nr:EAL domain-containing protein [Trinickia acidisoli]
MAKSTSATGHNAPDSGTPRLIDRLEAIFSRHVVPVIIVSLSLLLPVSGTRYYSSSDTLHAAMKVLKDESGTLDPGTARRALSLQPAVLYRDTHLSERPFWLSVETPVPWDSGSIIVEFPSRHTQAIACWDLTSLMPLGNAERTDDNAPWNESLTARKAGFALRLSQHVTQIRLLCRATSIGPARLTVKLWNAKAFRQSEELFHRDVGLLEGSMLILAVFAFITALINHEGVFILLAVWLVGNLRLAELSIGSDMQWLGYTVPYSWMPVIRQLTVATYFIVTYSMLDAVFKQELAAVGRHQLILRAARFLGRALLLAAIVLPYRTFLPVMWVIASLGIGGVVFILFRLIASTHSRVAVWFAASLSITLFASFSDVLGTAFRMKGLVAAFDSMTATLLSSLIAALAVAEQLRIEHRRLAITQSQFQETYDTTPVGLFTLDLDGHIIRGNPALRRIMQYDSRSEDHPWTDYFEAGAWDKLRAIAHRRGGEEIELRSAAATGELPKWFLLKATLTRGHIEGSLQDITARKRASERLHFLAEHDALTGTLNRFGLEKTITRLMNTSAIPGAFVPFGLAYLDLDRFKLINDLFGHHAGDAVLQQVVERINTKIGHDDALGRIGGDEFVIVVRSGDMEHAAMLCHNLASEIAGPPYQLGRRAFQVRASIGMLEVSQAIDVSDAISAADRACRAAKFKHDHVVVYRHEAAVLTERAETLRLIDRLRGDLRSAGLYLEMQPIMSVRTPYDTLDFEVLLRMRDAMGGTVPPVKVIAAAEESGHISELDKWVLTTTLEWLEQHSARLSKTRFVCVNLSGASLNDEHFVSDIFNLLDAHAPILNKLCIEITEGVALHDLVNTRRFINRLQAAGAKIALDDFGAGYTSFSYLKNLPADALKIDGAFIRSMAEHSSNTAIVEAIVALASNLGIRSIAEWVEDCGTLETLATFGVDYVQGWVISPAQSPDAILNARSAADFIEDEHVAAFVRRHASESGNGPFSYERSDTFPF